LFENADPLIAEHDRLEAQLADPATHADPALMRRVLSFRPPSRISLHFSGTLRHKSPPARRVTAP